MFRRPFLLLVLAAFVPLAALSVALGIATLRAEQHAIERDALERVRVLSSAIARDLAAQLDVLRVLAQSRDFDGPVSQDSFAELAARVKREMPAWRALRLTDPQMQVVADAPMDPDALGASQGRIIDTESHQDAVATKTPVIGKVVYGPRGRHAFAVRAPVVRDGAVKYVISAVISPDSLRERFLVPGLPDEWVATAIDGAGNIAARSTGHDTLIGEPASANARAARQRGGEGIYEGLTLEGIRTLSAYHMLPVGNWSVHIGVPADVMMAPVRRSLWMIGAGLAATLLLAGTFLWLLMREIRLRRQEEFGLEGARRLEALGRMTGGVAHDFNNLLMIVQGGAEGIKRRMTDPARLRSYADAILTAVQRGQALTRQLLAFAQRSTHEPESFRIQDRAAELNELLSRSVRQNIDVRLSFPANTWPMHADPDAFDVALINLAVNASDAMPAGGPLLVSAMNILLNRGREGNPGLEGAFVALTVSDKGSGIPPEHVGHIFEPFFTTKPKGKGTGLGLSQVYGFAQQSGGAVTVKSRPGEGTTFTLFLPRALEVTDTARPPTSTPTASDKGRILLVEDDPSVAQVTADMLMDAGYEVTPIETASSALDLLHAGRSFDAILSDIVMVEGISGLDLARRVREEWPQMPVVLMTGFSEALTGAQFVEVPVVFKPFTQEEILAALRQVRRREGAAAS